MGKHLLNYAAYALDFVIQNTMAHKLVSKEFFAKFMLNVMRKNLLAETANIVQRPSKISAFNPGILSKVFGTRDHENIICRPTQRRL